MERDDDGASGVLAPVLLGVIFGECIKRLRQAGAQNPPGRTYHACFGPSDKLSVFDVWTSQKAFDKFGQTLMPILQQIGIDPGQPSVMAVRRVIVPTAAAPRATKRAPTKRSAPRRAAKRR